MSRCRVTRVLREYARPLYRNAIRRRPLCLYDNLVFLSAGRTCAQHFTASSGTTPPPTKQTLVALPKVRRSRLPYVPLIPTRRPQWKRHRGPKGRGHRQCLSSELDPSNVASSAKRRRESLRLESGGMHGRRFFESSRSSTPNVLSSARGSRIEDLFAPHWRGGVAMPSEQWRCTECSKTMERSRRLLQIRAQVCRARSAKQGTGLVLSLRSTLDGSGIHVEHC